MTTLTNEQAHQRLTLLNKTFDEYNQSGFLQENDFPWALLRPTQLVAQEGLELIKFLQTKEPQNDALIFYRMSVGKVLIRLSSLIHAGRKETEAEYGEWIQLYLKPVEVACG